jgi:transcription antitermination protein NusB
MLFQFDIGQQPVDALLNTYWTELGGEYAEDVREFASRLVVGTVEQLEAIDDRIRDRAENWRIARMAVVDRNILRLAVYEFLRESDTPKTVVINEALEIARRFSTFEATQFINGILDAIKRDLEKHDAESPVETKAD